MKNSHLLAFYLADEYNYSNLKMISGGNSFGRIFTNYIADYSFNTGHTLLFLGISLSQGYHVFVCFFSWHLFFLFVRQ